MVKLLPGAVRRVRRALRLDPPKQKAVPGHRLDIDISTAGGNDESRSWHRVDGAAHIPSNDRNMVSLALAKEIGLVASDDSGDMVERTVELLWKERKQGSGTTSYACKAEFVVRKDLPCGVVFGKHDPNKMFPESFPSPFKGTPIYDFDKSYNYSKPQPIPQPILWKTIMLVGKSASWPYSGRSKAKPQPSSFPQELAQTSPTAIPLASNQSNLTKIKGTLKMTRPVKRDRKLRIAANDPGTRNDQIAIKSSTRLDTIVSNDGTEVNTEENTSSECRVSNICKASNVAPLSTERQQQHLDVGLRVESVSTTESSLVNTPENPSTERHQDLVMIDAVLPQETNQSPISLAASENGPKLWRNSWVPPTSSNTAVSNLVELPSHYAPGHSVRSDRDTLVQSTSALPPDTNTTQNVKISSRQGERDGANVVNDSSEIVNEEHQQLEALHTLTLTRKRGNEEMGEERRLKRDPMELSDTALRDTIERRAETLMPELGAFEGLGTEAIQSTRRRSQELDVSSLGVNDLDGQLENEPNLDVRNRVEERPSVLMTENGSTRAELRSLKKEEMQSCDSDIDVFHPKDSEHQSNNQIMLDQTNASHERSVSTVQGLSSATTLPLDHGEVTSFGVERFLESGQTTAKSKRTRSEVAQASHHSSSTQESQSRQQKTKRGKAPKIRSAKLDASQNVDLSPAPGADKYWTYDENLKAYYHIDSDTQSTFWYEDSSEDSEE